MPIQLVDILRDERTIEFQIQGQTGRLTYRPGAMTPELEMLLAVRINGPEGVSQIISELVAEWDVVGKDGKVVQTDFETIMSLPSELVSIVFRAINDDMTDRREERKNSGAGSQQAASKAKRRTGSTLSRPQKS